MPHRPNTFFTVINQEEKALEIETRTLDRRLTHQRPSLSTQFSRNSICVGAMRLSYEASREARNSSSVGTKNLLVDLDKIEKTAGMTKVRRRNSITVGELHEARVLKLEASRNGVIHPSYMHQEWRRNRFQALYQAMKRRKMLMRLQKRRPVPREVDQELKRSDLKDPGFGSRSQSVPHEEKVHTLPIPAKSKRSISSIGGTHTITLDRVRRHSRQSSKIFVVNNIPLVLLPAAQLKLAKTEKKVIGSGMVFLARHGEREDHVNPKWYLNAPNVFDPPLSNKGLRQAAELGERLRSESITHIFASPFTRTIQTAIEVAKKLNLMINIDRGLAEHMETKHFQVTCARLQLDPNTFKVQVNTHEELIKRYPKYISPETEFKDLKLNKWPALFPEEEEELFERTNNTVKHLGIYAFNKKANILLVSHQTPVEYMAFELSSEAEDKFVSVCCLTKVAPRKNDPKKKGWKLIFQHDDSFLSEPECGKR